MSTYECISAVTNIIIALFSIFAAISAIIAYVQYQKQKKDSFRGNDYERKKQACEMAKYFESEILPLMSFIGIVVKSQDNQIFSELSKIFPPNKISEFDYHEMTELLKLSQKDIQDIEKKMRQVDPVAILNSKLVLLEDESKFISVITYFADITRDDKPTEKGLKESQLRQDFSGKIMHVLNKLEWFSMNFHFNIADENTVYQSLHGAFISTVCSLYYYIASRNESNPNKLYTNVIWLYNLWRDRLTVYQEEQRLKEKEARGSIHVPPPVDME